ncbi:MAG: class I SAM-dependent methyltransferase [Chthoniobacterales bacterium]|nr:class I SAM-dependent methyltransferase [Chthoniobacterales bacterium]
MRESLSDCIGLMEALIEYRQKPISNELQVIRHKHSMLHLDVLTLIYYFAATGSGEILEIGPYLGGSTIAAALGARASSAQRKLVSIEPGGRHQHDRLPSKDILRDLKKNLRKHRLEETVTLVPGYSWQEETIAEVKTNLKPGSVGLMMIDADGEVKRDLSIYGDLLADRCNLVIDDYVSLKSGGKDLTTRPQIDGLVDAGVLQPLGIYGWGTWIGRWLGSGKARDAGILTQ